MESESSETPRQQAHHVTDPLIARDVLAELATLRASAAYASADHAARTISKQLGMRVVLVSLKAGGRMEEHHADAPITLHGIDGAVDFTAGVQRLRVTPSALVTLAAGVTHAASAVEESAFLLTVGAVVEPEDNGEHAH